MAVAQSAICADGSDFGLFLTFTLAAQGDDLLLRSAVAGLPDLTDAVAAKLHEPALVSSIAIGAAAWDRVTGGVVAKPKGLLPFQALADQDRTAPATPADLFVHIHSPRMDANLALARAVTAALGDTVDLVEEVVGFKTQGGRDLTGFVDGTENPQGEDRAPAALVADGDHAQGSFVSIQRYVHNLHGWESLPTHDQEKHIGRTKENDQELDDATKPPTAHIARVVIEENGEELQILRHSLPYGSTSEAGLYFIAYGASPGPFRRMLKRMVECDADGHYDHLLDYTRPVTGAAFFAPSRDVLEKLAP